MRHKKPPGTSKKGFCHQKLFWPFTAWINCSTDREKLLKFEAEGREFAKNIFRKCDKFLTSPKSVPWAKTDLALFWVMSKIDRTAWKKPPLVCEHYKSCPEVYFFDRNYDFF